MQDNPIVFLTLLAAALLAGAVLHAFLLVRGSSRTGVSAAVLTPLFGLPIGWLLSKLVVFAAHLGAELQEKGAAALIDTNPETVSFAAAAIGLCFGAWLAARVMKLQTETVLEAYAAPLCLIVAVARFAEYWLGSYGLGEYSTVGLGYVSDGDPLAFFPLGVREAYGDFGDWLLAVFTLETLAALACLAYALVTRKRPQRFGRTVYLLCACQLLLELLHGTPLICYFVHVDQVLCAVIMLVLFILAGLRLKKAEDRSFPWGGLAVIIVCMALNALAQFLMDKTDYFIQYLPEAMEQWISEPEHLAWVGYGLILLTIIGMVVCYSRICRRAEKAEAAQDPGTEE